MARASQDTHRTQPTSPAGRHRVRTFQSLRNRDYRLLWSGNLFNSGANWLQQATIGWLMWELTSSPFLVGTVGGFPAVPFLVVGRCPGYWPTG